MTSGSPTVIINGNYDLFAYTTNLLKHLLLILNWWKGFFWLNLKLWALYSYCLKGSAHPLQVSLLQTQFFILMHSEIHVHFACVTWGRAVGLRWHISGLLTCSEVMEFIVTEHTELTAVPIDDLHVSQIEKKRWHLIGSIHVTQKKHLWLIKGLYQSSLCHTLHPDCALS